MKMRLHCAIAVLFVFVISSCSKESSDNTDIVEVENAVEVEQELTGMINGHRASLGYTSLQFNAVAYQYANAHTDYMIAKGNINHDNFSARASKISAEVNASYVAENVAKDYSSAAEAFENWISSSGHRKNIEGNFTHAAISVKKDANGNFYYTQLFYR